jgi:hypothetical protein
MVPAFDHYICSKLYTLNEPHLFATEVWLNDIEAVVAHPLNHALSDAFHGMFLNQNGNEPSQLMNTSIQADKANGTYYYARPQEIAARAFERMVQENPIKNAFLVRGTIKSAEAQLGLYPSGAALTKITTPLTAYFAQLGQSVLNNSNKSRD